MIQSILQRQCWEPENHQVHHVFLWLQGVAHDFFLRTLPHSTTDTVYRGIQLSEPQVQPSSLFYSSSLVLDS